uniref:Pecanex-like protein n=1 Tax=Macrostomum lignano TaxID=282301 RepID=A0A1I8FR71_9PLAT
SNKYSIFTADKSQQQQQNQQHKNPAKKNRQKKKKKKKKHAEQALESTADGAAAEDGAATGKRKLQRLPEEGGSLKSTAFECASSREPGMTRFTSDLKHPQTTVQLIRVRFSCWDLSRWSGGRRFEQAIYTDDDADRQWDAGTANRIVERWAEDREPCSPGMSQWTSDVIRMLRGAAQLPNTRHQRARWPPVAFKVSQLHGSQNPRSDCCVESAKSGDDLLKAPLLLAPIRVSFCARWQPEPPAVVMATESWWSNRRLPVTELVDKILVSDFSDTFIRHK